MALQVKEISGRKYVYDVKSFWDKKQKKVQKINCLYGTLHQRENQRVYAQKGES